MLIVIIIKDDFLIIFHDIGVYDRWLCSFQQFPQICCFVLQPNIPLPFPKPQCWHDEIIFAGKEWLVRKFVHHFGKQLGVFFALVDLLEKMLWDILMDRWSRLYVFRRVVDRVGCRGVVIGVIFVMIITLCCFLIFAHFFYLNYRNILMNLPSYHQL